MRTVQVRLSAVQSRLHQVQAPASISVVSSALGQLAAAANKPEATASDLDNAASAFLQVEPASLRRPDLAVQWALRAVALTHRRSPSFLLLLASAYKTNHETQKARETAEESLSRLPAQTEHPSGTHMVRMLRSIACCRVDQGKQASASGPSTKAS